MKYVILVIVVAAASAATWFTFQGRSQDASATPVTSTVNASPVATPALTDSVPERIRGDWHRPARQPVGSEPIRVDLGNSQMTFYFPQRPETGVAMPVVFVRQDEANAWVVDVTVSDQDFGKSTQRYLVRLLENSPIGEERLGNVSTLKSMVTISRWWGDLNAAPTTQEQDARRQGKSIFQQMQTNVVGYRPLVSSGSFLTKADADKWSKYLVDRVGW